MLRNAVSFCSFSSYEAINSVILIYLWFHTLRNFIGVLYLLKFSVAATKNPCRNSRIGAQRNAKFLQTSNWKQICLKTFDCNFSQCKPETIPGLKFWCLSLCWRSFVALMFACSTETHRLGQWWCSRCFCKRLKDLIEPLNLGLVAFDKFSKSGRNKQQRRANCKTSWRNESAAHAIIKWSWE